MLIARCDAVASSQAYDCGSAWAQATDCGLGGQGTRAASANGQSNYQKPLTPLIFRHSRFAVHADLVMNIGTFTTHG